MNIFVTGASGLIGSQLVPLLESAGHQVTQLVRRMPSNERERSWDTGGRRMASSVLEGCDVLIHLAGEGIASGRWTLHKKHLIRSSRVDTTAILVDAMNRMKTPPKVFIVASAIGYYGDRGDEVLTESSLPGQSFLSDVCAAWESAANPVRQKMRVVHVRTGIVLSPRGGALKSMLLPFQMGLGGVVGNGKQYWSWITLEDIARLYLFAVENESLCGPINGVSPQPVTNREFTKSLGRALNRPTRLPLPRLVAKVMLGQMADELLLASARVLPQVAQEQGFEFRNPELQGALNSLGISS